MAEEIFLTDLRANRGPFLTSPRAHRVNLAPRGEIGPLGDCSPLCSPPGVNTLHCLEEWRGEQRISPLGDNFAPGVKVKNGPQEKFAQLC
jgi:hypothetical protein